MSDLTLSKSHPKGGFSPLCYMQLEKLLPPAPRWAGSKAGPSGPASVFLGRGGRIESAFKACKLPRVRVPEPVRGSNQDIAPSL
jgi:hypothetical protein